MKINETNNNSQQKFNIVTIQRKKRMVNKMHNLSKNDYIKILKYYNIRAPKSSKTMKKRAEQILADVFKRLVQTTQYQLVYVLGPSLITKDIFAATDSPAKKEETRIAALP
jgi:hypothetical protein